MNSPKSGGLSVASIREELNGHSPVRPSYLVHCSNCYAAIITISPRPEYEIILTDPCPICNGLEQSFCCDYCLQKNRIYWDKKHFDWLKNNREIKQWIMLIQCSCIRNFCPWPLIGNSIQFSPISDNWFQLAFLPMVFPIHTSILLTSNRYSFQLFGLFQN